MLEFIKPGKLILVSSSSTLNGRAEQKFRIFIGLEP